MRRNSFLISVIVPVFRVESYIDECILSILRQKETNIEIILVDDGSPDRCGEICDYYAGLDARIRVIHKNQGGLSDARNVGIQAARGEYIAFVDSDDFVSCDMLSEMLLNLKKNDADISICGHIRTNERGKPFYPVRWKKNKFLLMNSCEAIQKMMNICGYESFSWNKLYKKELFEGIHFPVGKIYEDLFTTYKLFDKSERIVYSTSVKYFYRQRNGSIIHGMTGQKCKDFVLATSELKDFIYKKYPKIARKATSFHCRAQITCFFFFLCGLPEKVLKKISCKVFFNRLVHKTRTVFFSIMPPKQDEDNEVYESERGV